MDEADVTIGTNVWIGAGAIILAGSSIGSHAVIGAGAVVNGPINDGQVYAGAKAAKVGQR